MTQPGTPLATSDLLTIDVEAEIRKLCGRQLDSPAECLVELTRLAIQSGGKAVRVDVRRRATTIQTIGGSLSDAVLEALALVGDPTQPSRERHAALVAIEAAHGVGLLTLVAAPAATVTVSNAAGGRTLLLEAGRSPRWIRARESGPGLILRIARRGRRGTERQTLRERCAFASMPVFLDGRLVSRGLVVDDCIIELVVDAAGLTCKVGLPRTGQLSRTTMLVQEVVARETYTASRRGAVHIAVVRDRVATGIEQVDLRGANVLVRSVRNELYERLARGFNDLAARDRLAARELLLRYAEKAGRTGLLVGVPLFRRLSGDRVDVEAVRALARGGAVWAVEPDTSTRRYVVDARQVLVLERGEREFVARSLGLGIQEPPALSRDTLVTRLTFIWRRLKDGLLDRGRRVVGRLLGAHPIAPGRWTAVERALMGAVQDELASGRYSLPAVAAPVSRGARVLLVERGSLPLMLRRRGADWFLLVPRRHPRVVQVMRLFAREPSSLYPIMAALFGGHDGYGVAKAALQLSCLGRVRVA
jgi:hypothetical protein